MSEAVVLRDVSFAYGGVPVLRGASLSVPRGGFAALIGPNGSGKTTILKLVLGLLAPARGEVRVLDREPVRARPRVGYLPQATRLDPSFPITVAQVVMLGRLGPRPPLGPPRTADREAARRALDAVEAGDLFARPFADLSGGQRQRVLLARALATEPELLLLDEPTAALDPVAQRDLYELLVQLSARLTILVVSHDVSVVSRHIRQILCVHAGHVHQPGAHARAELAADVFPGMADMVLVRHDHRDCPPPTEAGGA